MQHCKRACNTPSLSFKLKLAGNHLRQGGLIAYPTEAVFGLGCDPLNAQAVQTLLELKQRAVDKGLILIAANVAQLAPFVDLSNKKITQKPLASWPGPHTWILPARKSAPSWITGQHQGIAVRVTTHPVAAALCHAFGGAIVSTSANQTGQTPAHTPFEVRQRFPSGVMVLQGATSGLSQPTPIRDALSGRVIRD